MLIENREKIAKILLALCFGVWGVTWLYSIAFVDWGIIAGFFMGMVYGGNLAIVPFVIASYVFVKSKLQNSDIISVLFISGIWFFFVRLLYWL